MKANANNSGYSKRLCDERHDNIERDFDDVKEDFRVVHKRIDSINAKLWAMLILLFMNLGMLAARFLIWPPQ